MTIAGGRARFHIGPSPLQATWESAALTTLHSHGAQNRISKESGQKKKKPSSTQLPDKRQHPNHLNPLLLRHPDRLQLLLSRHLHQQHNRLLLSDDIPLKDQQRRFQIHEWTSTWTHNGIVGAEEKCCVTAISNTLRLLHDYQQQRYQQYLLNHEDVEVFRECKSWLRQTYECVPEYVFEDEYIDA